MNINCPSCGASAQVKKRPAKDTIIYCETCGNSWPWAKSGAFYWVGTIFMYSVFAGVALFVMLVAGGAISDILT